MANVRRTVSRTYNLPDTVSERVVRDLARRFRDDVHTRLWAQAGQDPGFQAEMRDVWDGYAAEDRAAWEPAASPTPRPPTAPAR